MKRVFLSIILIYIFTNMIIAQEESPKPLVVKEFLISSDAKAVFSEPVEKAYEYFGVYLACDLSGRMYLLDYDKQVIHIVNGTDFSIIKTFTVNPFPYDTHFVGDKNGLYYVSMSGFFQYIHHDGTVLFWGNLRDIMSFTSQMDIQSCFYHAGILFFMDNENQIHSILNPCMDAAQNKLNYRNPAQTKALFQKNSGIDLQGLTIGEKGLYFINGLYVGPYFNPIIGKWRYTVNSLGSDASSVGVGSFSQILIRFKIQMASDEETAEGFAVHPSGDIYIFRYNRTKKAHILYRIDNTWDPDMQNEWLKN